MWLYPWQVDVLKHNGNHVRLYNKQLHMSCIHTLALRMFHFNIDYISTHHFVFFHCQCFWWLQLELYKTNTTIISMRKEKCTNHHTHLNITVLRTLIHASTSTIVQRFEMNKWSKDVRNNSFNPQSNNVTSWNFSQTSFIWLHGCQRWKTNELLNSQPSMLCWMKFQI